MREKRESVLAGATDHSDDSDYDSHHWPLQSLRAARKKSDDISFAELRLRYPKPQNSGAIQRTDLVSR